MNNQYVRSCSVESAFGNTLNHSTILRARTRYSGSSHTSGMPGAVTARITQQHTNVAAAVCTSRLRIARRASSIPGTASVYLSACAIAASASGAITLYPAAFGWRSSSLSSVFSMPALSIIAE